MKKNIFLLSYPRSGNTFTRYILEYLTGLGSYGYKSGSTFEGVEKSLLNKNSKSEYKIIKRHGYYCHDISEIRDLNSKDNFFILLVRNPIEVAVRHDLGMGENFPPAKLLESCTSDCDSDNTKCNHPQIPAGTHPLLKSRFISNYKKNHDFSKNHICGGNSCTWNCENHTFFNNLKAFDNFVGEKKIFFYEDLIQEPKMFIKELCIFLNLNEVELPNAFMSKFEHHRQKALEYYFHDSKKRTDEEIKKLDRWSVDVPTQIKTEFWKNFDHNCNKRTESLLSNFDRYKNFEGTN